VTLLEDIQNAAVDAKSDLGTLLRKCKLLASRLGSQSLEDWLIWESNGYPQDVEVPEYRIWSLEVKGHFSGSFGSALRNAPIPIACLPEKMRKHYKRYECRQSIASIEEILKKSDGGTVEVSTGDLALILGTKVYQDQNCIQAWAEFSTGQLVELVNTVRNRILDFALAVWKEAPTAGDSGTEITPKIEAKRVTQIFNTTVYGGSANLVGTANASLIEFDIRAKDFSSLERVLRDNGVPETELVELHTAIESEEKPKLSQGFGPKVSSWISKMMGKAAEGSWNIGLGAAGNLLAQAIAKYYGL
jgi:AbiTii